MQVKRVPGASGRMRKNEEGEWEWSDEGECVDDAKQRAAAAVSMCWLIPRNLECNKGKR